MPDQLRLPSTSDAADATSARRPRIRQRLRTPLEARQWRRKMAGYALAGMSFVLIVNALVGDNGYLTTLRFKHDQQELEDAIRTVRDDNQRMREELDRLRNDPQELEDAARQYLHMTKPGEKLIIIKEPKQTTTPAK